MKVLAYIKNTLEVDAKEFMAFKNSMSPEAWAKLKEDARKDAEASGITLEADPPKEG